MREQVLVSEAILDEPIPWLHLEAMLSPAMSQRSNQDMIVRLISETGIPPLFASAQAAIADAKE